MLVIVVEALRLGEVVRLSEVVEADGTGAARSIVLSQVFTHNLTKQCHKI